jgi:hypothetical protein
VLLKKSARRWFQCSQPCSLLGINGSCRLQFLCKPKPLAEIVNVNTARAHVRGRHCVFDYFLLSPNTLTPPMSPVSYSALIVKCFFAVCFSC